MVNWGKFPPLSSTAAPSVSVDQAAGINSPRRKKIRSWSRALAGWGDGMSFTYDSPGGLHSRYGVLKSIGPDMFFAVLDYGPCIQEFDDMVVKLDGTFRAGR